MMTTNAVVILGGVVRWLLKGRKTKLRDEIHGVMDSTWGFSYRFENWVVGMIVILLFLSTGILLVYLFR
jgi:hypothetical protein